MSFLRISIKKRVFYNILFLINKPCVLDESNAILLTVNCVWRAVDLHMSEML